MKQKNFSISLPGLTLKFVKWITGLVVISVFILQLYIYLPVLSSPEDEYIARKGNLISEKITNQWSDEFSKYTELSLISDSGLVVELLVRQPQYQPGKRPAMLLMGGTGTGRRACKLIPGAPDVICVALSYPYSGDNDFSATGILRNLRPLQESVKNIPAAALLALDYIQQLSGVDNSHIELLGVSFGSYFISIPAALDTRVKRVWIAYGAGSPIRAIRHNLKDRVKSGLLRNILATALGYAVGGEYVDPDKWVGRVSPRPVIMINSETDKTFPRDIVDALHHAAKEPKEIIWVKGHHITPNEKEIIQVLTDIILNRIKQDYNL